LDSNKLNIYILLSLTLFQVEAIVDDKKEKGKSVYRIRWKGYGPGEDTWLPANELSCKDLLKKYKKKQERENKDVYTVS